jgi:hypothetical protein
LVVAVLVQQQVQQMALMVQIPYLVRLHLLAVVAVVVLTLELVLLEVLAVVMRMVELALVVREIHQALLHPKEIMVVQAAIPLLLVIQAVAVVQVQ